MVKLSGRLVISVPEYGKKRININLELIYYLDQFEVMNSLEIYTCQTTEVYSRV